MNFADQFYIGCFDHSIGSFYRCHKSLCFDHPQCLKLCHCPFLLCLLCSIDFFKNLFNYGAHINIGNIQ